MESEEIIEKRLVSLSLICFLISLAFPAIKVFVPSLAKSIEYDGWYALFAGSLSLTMNLKQSMVWLANPIYFLALLSMKRNPKLVLFFSVLASCNAIIFITFDNIQLTWSGRIAHIESVTIGYWLWLTSFSILSSAAIINQIRNYRMD